MSEINVEKVNVGDYFLYSRYSPYTGVDEMWVGVTQLVDATHKIAYIKPKTIDGDGRLIDLQWSDGSNRMDEASVSRIRMKLSEKEVVEILSRQRVQSLSPGTK